MTAGFSLTDPLPTGTTVLEASAGTGKTFAIAALAARFLAEGRVRVSDLLLVTFSRAATAELISRVRERIQDSGVALRRLLDDDQPPSDPVDRLLAADGPEETALRAARLEDALVHFDRATIMTTHEFCHQMLTGLGVLAVQEPQSRLIEDLSPLADEVGADVYLRRYAFADGVPFPYVPRDADDDPGARQIARDAVEHDGVIGPPDAPEAVGERVAFAEEVRREVAERKRRRRLFSFTDQLTRLRDALADPLTGDAARAKLAERFPVVLIDEFQDTDPVQWQVVRSAFGGPRSTLVLIGDPKQAIYQFRGADIHTYSSAARTAQARTTLTRNYRADAQVVAAVSGLFRGVLLGEDIAVPAIDAHHTEPRIVAPAGASPWAAGVQIRAVQAEAELAPWLAHERIDADLVRVTAELLGERPPLTRPDGSGLAASDIAVLVRSNWRGRDVARALNAAGIPATFSGTSSVFASDAATDWRALLLALDQTRRPYTQRAVLTDFVGGTVAQLATATDAQRADWSVWLHSWSRIARRSGIPALLSAIDRDTRFYARLLSREDGERAVTDHRHLAELLHAEHDRGRGHLRDLVDWLTDNMDDARATAGERTRRLETDEAAVQIMTVHRAKGLQFPVVLLPEVATDPVRPNDTGAALVLPLEDGRALDVGGRAGPDRPRRWDATLRSDADESLRALYVGVTRAESHVVTWWAPHWKVDRSPLHRLLHARHDEEHPERPALCYPTGGLDQLGSPLALGWLEGAGIATVAVDDAPAHPPAMPSGDPAALRARPWRRLIDQSWRRTSYSGLTAEANAEHLDADFVTDEADETVLVEPDPALAAPSPMASLPGGAAFGTLVHAVFEHLDARGEDWRERLAAEVRSAVGRWPIPGVEAVTLTDSLAPALSTPLGPLAEGTTLRDFGPGTRLSELDFEFPLDAPDATLTDVAVLLRTWLPAGHPLAGYPDRLTGPALTSQRLHGFLTGSIDGVLRLPSGAYLVVDYKTNHLGTPGSPLDELTLGHYTPPALAEAMMAHHYPLQALLYAVALHRFLRQRLRGYDPAVHLGGIAYLFVRGMAGAATPLVDGHPTGVFSWRPEPGLIQELSRLLAGGAA